MNPQSGRGEPGIDNYVINKVSSSCGNENRGEGEEREGRGGGELGLALPESSKQRRDDQRSVIRPRTWKGKANKIAPPLPPSRSRVRCAATHGSTKSARVFELLGYSEEGRGGGEQFTVMMA